MPLFEIVGVTSTKKPYFVAFVFLTSGKKENFTWVLLNSKDSDDCD